MTLYSIFSIGGWFGVAWAIYMFHYRHEFPLNEGRKWRILAIVLGLAWVIYGATSYDDDLKTFLGCYQNDSGDYVCDGPIDFF